MDHQAQALKGFLARITSKEAEPEEAEEGFAGEFSKLKRMSTKYRTEKVFSTKAAEKQGNVKKNRYKDIIPFDHTRVKLSLITSDTDTDYINANFVKGVLNQRAYIATQGPMPHTVLDFWRMIWQYNVEIIVMACREFEMGRKKCERYWPEKREEPFVCDPFTIHFESMESKGDYLTRVLSVNYCKTSRTLWQLHYVNWPDHGVPTSIPPILELLQEMRSYQKHDDVPICIHCSAGCGRTGVLCVIDYTWNLLQNQLITEDFSIFSLVQEMRTQRPSIVQTKEQYELVYRTIKILFENYLQMMINHSSAVEIPASPTPSPVSAETDHTSPYEVLYWGKGEEVLPVPLPRHLKREEPKQLTNQETTEPLPPVQLCLPVEENGCNSPVSQSPKCSPEDSRQRVQGKWHAQAEWHSSQHTQVVQEPEPILESLAIALPTQEDIPTQSPSRGDRNSSQEMEEVTLLQLEMKPSSPGCCNSSCFLVEDPYFGPSSLQDSPATLDPQEPPPFNSWISNQCHTNPALTLNDHPLVLPQFETLATASLASEEDVSPVLPERTPESYMLANSAGPATPTSDEDIPPVLPERTPESFILANSPDPPESPTGNDRERLLAVIPLNTTEMLSGNGSPPSPVPPLPERTPESFILATDDAASLQRAPGYNDMEQNSEQTEQAYRAPANPEQGVAQHRLLSPSPRVGMSSEWCGTSEHPSMEPKKSWTRSKSLKVRMSMLVSSSVSLVPAPDHSQPTAPPLPLTAKTGPGKQNSSPVLQPSREPSQRVGTSSEWAGNSHPKAFLDVVRNRSKSVRTKSSKNDRWSVACPAAASSMAAAPAGNAAAEPLVDSGASASAAVAGERQNKSNGKSALPSMTRTKSLKFLRNIRKSKGDPPPAAAPSEPPLSSGFRFGFGNRFGKPKGPRQVPDTWV